MGPDPLVTVLMPCRNAHPRFFVLALRSVFRQSSSRWRLLVLDDGTDAPETLSVFRRLERGGDPRVRIVPGGARHLTGVLNTGMRVAATPFVCALHCDDLLVETAVETLTDAIEADPEVDYFHSARRFVDERGRPLSRTYPAREWFTVADFSGDVCPVKALHCWRVDAALAIGGMDESLGLHGGDDYDFPWRMAEAGCRFRAIQDCLYLIRDHREHERLTTHVPLDVQLAQLRAILAKHGIDDEAIDEQLAVRRGDYLRQALFHDEADRRTKELAGFDPRNGWRESHSYD